MMNEPIYTAIKSPPKLLSENQPVNKLRRFQKTTREHMKAYTWGQGSIICFPWSQKFMSDGVTHWDWSITARFLPQWEITARNSSLFSIYHLWKQEHNLIKRLRSTEGENGNQCALLVGRVCSSKNRCVPQKPPVLQTPTAPWSHSQILIKR